MAKFRILIFLLMQSLALHAYNRSLFYRCSSFWDEPRFAIPSLSSLDVQLQTGMTSPHCFQAQKLKTCVELFQVDFNYYQNICRGFFIHSHIPYVLLKQRNRKKSALSDSTLFLGWSHTYQETEYLDFIDIMLQTGVLIPSGTKRKHHFDIPTGYNKQWGLPFNADISCGLYDWLTGGFHGDVTLLFSKKEHNDLVWRVGSYIKADHFFHGLSALLALSYERQSSHCCQDQWHRSIVHVGAEYDFAGHDSWWGLRIGLYYDHQISGKNVLKMDMLGPAFGIDFNWCY